MISPKNKAARHQASKHRDGLYVKQGGLCPTCGGPVQRKGRQSHVDHVVPLAAGGSVPIRKPPATVLSVQSPEGSPNPLTYSITCAIINTWNQALVRRDEMTTSNRNHNHGTDIRGARECSPECHKKASAAKVKRLGHPRRRWAQPARRSW